MTVQATQEEITKIANNLQKIYSGAIVVTDKKCADWRNGIELIDYKGLRVITCACSDRKFDVSEDEFKEQMFCWVYDTRNEKDKDKRKKFLFEKLSKKFEGYSYYVSVGDSKFAWAWRNCKVGAFFEDYGGCVLLIIY